MKYILLLICVMVSSTMIAQEIISSDFLFFPGSYNSHEAFHEDREGNYIVAGKGTGEIDFDFGTDVQTLPEGTDKDLYLAKYLENGDLHWLNILTSESTENEITAITTDENGNVYITGSFSEVLDFSGEGALITLNKSTFIAKFDRDGNLLWYFMIGNNDFVQYPEALFLHEDKLILQMVYSGDIDVDPTADETILDDNSNAVVVYGLNGGLIDAYSHRGGIDIEDSVIDSEGNLYLSGQFSGIASLDFKSNASLFSGGLFDGFVAKYNSNFDLEWTSRIQKNVSTNTIYQLALDSNNDLIAAANIEAGVAVGGDTTENHAHFLLDISKEGDITNPIEFLPDGSFITDLEIASDGKIFATGCYTNELDIDPTAATTLLGTMDDAVNFFFGAYNADYSLIVADRMYGMAIPNHNIYLNDDDEATVLTDFQGSGKVAFGSGEVFEAEEEENFILYKLAIDNCTPTAEQIVLQACDAVEINGFIYEMSGTYEQVLTNSEGCDSTLSIELTVYPSTITETAITSCGPYTYEGQIIGVSGIYEFLLLSTFGCDSLVQLELTVIDLNQSVSIDGNELISNEADGDTYQWYDCDLTMEIEGATERVFMPAEDGSYRVQVFKGGCSFLSDCVDFMLVNTNEISSRVSISPNPTKDIIYIEGIDELSDTELFIYDVNGRLVKKLAHDQIINRIDLSSLNTGTYMMSIISDEGQHLEKIIRF